MNSSRLASYLVTFSCFCKSISVGREIRKSFSTFTCCIVLIVLETKYLGFVLYLESSSLRRKRNRLRKILADITQSNQELKKEVFKINLPNLIPNILPFSLPPVVFEELELTSSTDSILEAPLKMALLSDRFSLPSAVLQRCFHLDDGSASLCQTL